MRNVSLSLTKSMCFFASSRWRWVVTPKVVQRSTVSFVKTGVRKQSVQFKSCFLLNLFACVTQSTEAFILSDLHLSSFRLRRRFVWSGPKPSSALICQFQWKKYRTTSHASKSVRWSTAVTCSVHVTHAPDTQQRRNTQCMKANAVVYNKLLFLTSVRIQDQEQKENNRKRNWSATSAVCRTHIRSIFLNPLDRPHFRQDRSIDSMWMSHKW